MNDYRSPPHAPLHATQPDTGGLRGLARRLVADGRFSHAAAVRAEEEARESEVSLLEHVIDTGLVSARQATLTAAWEYGLPIMDLDAIRADTLPKAERFPEKILRKLKVLPLIQHGHRLTVAVPYPSTLAQLDELQFATGLTPEGILAPVDQLVPVLEGYLANSEKSMLDSLKGVDDAIGELGYADDDGSGEVDIQAEAQSAREDAPIIKFVNKILLDAINRGASDIHFEPYETSYRVRFRIDGMLHDVAHPPFAMRTRIAARLKVMSRLDISERRLPQDGAIKLRLSKSRSIDFRVNSLPTVYGEKVVLRILDPTSAQIGIEQLGFTPEQKAMYETVLDQPQGMILVTGPTGSGKTTTLYASLTTLNDRTRNILTVEDPIEYNLEGIGQTQVNTKVEMTFARGLRAILRQDPDVVMVGEIRDQETADMAVQASLTGHLVLSTLHTNSAIGAVTRLVDMGVEPFLISSSLLGVLAQRLVRVLCDECKRAYVADEAECALFGLAPDQAPTLYHAEGCDACRQLGYRGRTGIYELVLFDDSLRSMIHTRATEQDMTRHARELGPSIRDDGLRKVREGVTTIEEVLRVTSEDRRSGQDDRRQGVERRGTGRDRRATDR